VPEGDTVFLAAMRLRRALAGQVLTRTDFRMPRIAAVDLSGRRVDDVVSRGKHLLVRIEGGVTLHTHYKMEGSWHLYRPGERWRGPGWQVRVLLETEPWIAVGFRLAVAELIETAHEREIAPGGATSSASCAGSIRRCRCRASPVPSDSSRW
jgi:endonuclease-8